MCNRTLGDFETMRERKHLFNQKDKDNKYKVNLVVYNNYRLSPFNHGQKIIRMQSIYLTMYDIATINNQYNFS